MSCARNRFESDLPDDSFLRNAVLSLELLVEGNGCSCPEGASELRLSEAPSDQSDLRHLVHKYQYALVNDDTLEWESLETWRDLDLYRLLRTSIPLLDERLPPSFRHETQTMLANLDVWIAATETETNAVTPSG